MSRAMASLNLSPGLMPPVETKPCALTTPALPWTLPAAAPLGCATPPSVCANAISEAASIIANANPGRPKNTFLIIIRLSMNAPALSLETVSDRRFSIGQPIGGQRPPLNYNSSLLQLVVESSMAVPEALHHLHRDIVQ